MSKMSELSMLLDDLIQCGEKLTETGKALKAFYSSTDEPAATPEKTGKKQSAKLAPLPEAKSKDNLPEPEAEPQAVSQVEEQTAPEHPALTANQETAPATPVPAKTYDKEEIRALLAAKAAESDGIYRAQVRDLVKKYGNGGSLTDVDPKDYADLAADTEAIGHAG